jgi:hypothetical protein
MQFRFDDLPVVCRPPSLIGWFAKQQIRYPKPLGITQHLPIHVQHPNFRM